MKVIVAGFIKTGTTTVAAALDVLGYHVHDFEHHFHYFGNEWVKIMNEGGTKEDFIKMYTDVDAGADVPFCLFWEEIADAFPEAKIIFMQRSSEDVWVESMEKQVEMVNSNYSYRALSFLSYTGYRYFKYLVVLNRTFLAIREHYPWNAFKDINSLVARKRYRDHCTGVLNRAPKDRLLVYKLSDGWEPLCKFLGKEVPDVPFPHLNVGGAIITEWMQKYPIFKNMQRERMWFIAVTIPLVCYGSFKLLSWSFPGKFRLDVGKPFGWM